MTTPEFANYENQARKVLEGDVHYLNSLMQMADSREVVARDEVHSASGIKLIDKGVTISSKLRDRLLKHVLLKPIDQSLEVKNGVAAGLLAQEVARQIAADPYLTCLLPNSEAFQEMLHQLRVPNQLWFKLTVVREQLPWLFEHKLTVLVISYFLAQSLRLSAQQCTATVLVALTHDLGELHTDPAVLDRRHRMTEEELHYVDVHPVTGYLIAKEILGAYPEVANAVLQHHERLDGSGYPHRLRGAAIGQLARIVAAADGCASIIARSCGGERLRALMRLNRQKFDPALIALLEKSLSRCNGATQEMNVALVQIQAAARLLNRWTKLSAELHDKSLPKPNFMLERIADLRVMLVQFGMDLEGAEPMQALIGDEEIARELGAVLDEVRWQIVALQREILRHRESVRQTLSSQDGQLLDNCLAEIRDYLQAVAPGDHTPATERRRN